jgi:hypothetical protein
MTSITAFKTDSNRWDASVQRDLLRVLLFSPDARMWFSRPHVRREGRLPTVQAMPDRLGVSLA